MNELNKKYPAYVPITNEDKLLDFFTSYCPPGTWGLHIRLPKKGYLDLANIGDFYDLIRAGTHKWKLILMVAQLESGSQGTAHWQCTFFLQDKPKLEELRHSLGLPSNQNLYYLKWVQDPAKALSYASKADTRVDGPYYIYKYGIHNLPFSP